MMDDRKAVYQAVFANAFEAVKREFARKYPSCDEGDVSPAVRAIKEAINTLLPWNVDVLELEEENKTLRQILKYDVTAKKAPEVVYHGKIKATQIEDSGELLESVFDMSPEAIASLKHLSLSGWSNDDISYIGDVPEFDVLSDQEAYIRHLLDIFLVFYSDYFIRTFDDGIDYNSIYSLSTDPIIPFSEITKKDSTLDALRGAWQSVEDPQKNIQDIQLIPKVPESVKKVFQTAKQLYVYGYFNYAFFTVSHHYAFLALESAIVNRYEMSLGKSAAIKYYKEETVMNSPTHQRIWDLCKKNKWRKWGKLTVNGEPFPHSRPMIIEWLVEKDIIGRWEKEAYYKNFLDLRNSFSHLTKHIVMMPSSQRLAIAAKIINGLFHQDI
jgi:hypothetical protein